VARSYQGVGYARIVTIVDGAKTVVAQWTKAEDAEKSETLSGRTCIFAGYYLLERAIYRRQRELRSKRVWLIRLLLLLTTNQYLITALLALGL
jgi:surface polysaccharide O-acyltransferase-like enzyme